MQRLAGPRPGGVIVSVHSALCWSAVVERGAAGTHLGAALVTLAQVSIPAGQMGSSAIVRSGDLHMINLAASGGAMQIFRTSIRPESR